MRRDLQRCEKCSGEYFLFFLKSASGGNAGVAVACLFTIISLH